jgi:RNA polymerase sigma factor (sigma-70 family)
MMNAMLSTQPHQGTTVQGQGAPDGILVGQALAGDQRAFELLVSRYRQPLLSCIRGFLKDEEEVNDVLQHVFLQLYLSLPILLRNVSLRPWLFQVARHRCLDELRKRRCKAAIPFSTLEWKYREEELSPVEAIPDPEPMPEEVVERIDMQCSLSQALSSLSPKCRSIVGLHCFRQLSFAEIAWVLNIPRNTVKTYYYRSLPHLRRALLNNVHFASIS